MTDLSNLPPELIGPVAVAFALALFISKIFDLIEKYRKIFPAELSDDTRTKTDQDILLPSHLSKTQIFSYSFIGAIFISVISMMAMFIFIDNHDEYLNAQLKEFYMRILFSLVSAVICAYFISNKFVLIRQSKTVCLFMGFGITALISMPISLVSMIMFFNR